MTDLILDAFRQQAAWCRTLGSPFTALLMDALAAGLDRTTAVGRRVLDWPGQADAMHDALPLRLAGGLHALVRRGALPDLAALYPPNPLPAAAALWAAVAPALDHKDLPAWLDSAPQTNEVARSAVLMPGLMTVASRTGLPLALLELGSSAGLNLVPDRYSYDLGGTRAGAPGARLHLAPEWRGPAPAATRLQVASRRGVDLNPIDVAASDGQERLLAYVWPDQPDRSARIAAAIATAAADPPPIDRADAASWTERHARPEPGVATVVMHSIAFQYFPAAAKARIAAHLDTAGATATQAAPLAWLRFEVDPRYPGSPSLLLTSWPGGAEERLATANAHVQWIEWRA